MTSQSFTHSATVPAPRSHVWPLFDQPDTWAGVAGIDRVSDPVFEEGQLKKFAFESRVGGAPYRGTVKKKRREEGQVIGWRVSSSEIRGKITVELGNGEDETPITVTLKVEAAGMLGTMFFGAIAAAIGNGFNQTVEDFAERLASHP